MPEKSISQKNKEKEAREKFAKFTSFTEILVKVPKSEIDGSDAKKRRSKPSETKQGCN